MSWFQFGLPAADSVAVGRASPVVVRCGWMGWDGMGTRHMAGVVWAAAVGGGGPQTVVMSVGFNRLVLVGCVVCGRLFFVGLSSRGYCCWWCGWCLEQMRFWGE